MTGQPLRALSIRQPWAWAILTGQKDVENRAWTRRPGIRPGERLLVHAGGRIDYGASLDPILADAWLTGDHPDDPADLPTGALLGTVTTLGIHHADDCREHVAARTAGPRTAWQITRGTCSPWAQPNAWHIGLADPAPFDEPIPCKGQLRLWTPPQVVG